MRMKQSRRKGVLMWVFCPPGLSFPEATFLCEIPWQSLELKEGRQRAEVLREGMQKLQKESEARRLSVGCCYPANFID